MLATLTDAHVVRRAAAGDQQAWTQLVRQHGGRLRAIALGLRLSPGDAEDAMQMTWLGLFRNVGRLQSQDKVAGWLNTTMRRNCLRLLHRRARERPTDDLPLGAADSGTGVERSLLLAERDRTLWRVVEQLPARQARLVRALFADEQRPYNEIASDLSIPVGAIGPVRQRALRRLAHLLAEEGMRHEALELSA